MRQLFAAFILLSCVSCESDRTFGPAPGSSTGSNTNTGAECTYLMAGNLEPDSGEGVGDTRVWAPGIISPLGGTNAVTKSQVYLPGGSQSAGSDQCTTSNFSYPHRDTFCETRSADRDSLNCPRRNIHLGIDINAGNRLQCMQLQAAQFDIRNGASPTVADIIPIRAVADGLISYVGQYTVDLRPAEGAISRFRYLHMNMRTLRVAFGDEVKQGDLLGFYYNDFAGTPTTFHLHFEVIAFVDGEAQYVSPYMSFIKAEERSKGVTCKELG